MCMTDDADISNPPQVGPQPVNLALDSGSAESVVHASNIVPAPAFLDKTRRGPIPEKALLTTVSGEEADLTQTARTSPRAGSVLPNDPPISVPQSEPVSAPCEPSPYTSALLPVGGVPSRRTSPFRQSILTAKDRLHKLAKVDLSILSMLLDIPRSQGGQQQQQSQAQSRAASPEVSSTLSTLAAVDTSLDEGDAFPVSAVKVQGRKAGSTRAMGSLEWLSLCSGPPKANSWTICPPSLLAMHHAGPLAHLIGPTLPDAWYAYLPAYLTAGLIADQSADLTACLTAHLPAYLPACIQTTTLRMLEMHVKWLCLRFVACNSRLTTLSSYFFFVLHSQRMLMLIKFSSWSLH